MLGLSTVREERQLLTAEEDSPHRGNLRAKAAANQFKASHKWKHGEREGNHKLSVGAVVSVSVDKVDRNHVDFPRLPGVVVEVTEHDDRNFYKVAVMGGVLTTAFTRWSLQHIPLVNPAAYGLEGLTETWRTLPEVSVYICLTNTLLIYYY